MVQEALLKIYARGVVSYFYFSRAPRLRALKIRQINSTILKVPDGASSSLVGTDTCRGTVPMEPPMPNSSMRHREPKSEIDDTGHFLQGASCTIAARRQHDTATAAHFRTISITILNT
jgi:hypothetical protein